MNDNEKPFLSVRGNGGEYELTWAITGAVRSIYDNDPRYWILAAVLDNVYGDTTLSNLASALRFHLGSVEMEAAKEEAERNKSYSITLNNLSSAAKAKIQAMLDQATPDYIYVVREEQRRD